jgi:hypothetical protein
MKLSPVMQVLTEYNQNLLRRIMADEQSKIAGEGYLLLDFNVMC